MEAERLTNKIRQINNNAVQRQKDKRCPSVPEMSRIEDDRLQQIKEACHECPGELSKIILNCFDIRFKHYSEYPQPALRIA